MLNCCRSLLILLLCANAYGADARIFLNKAPAAAQTFLLSEDFEGASPGWGSLGSPTTVDFSYGTGPLEGSKSLRVVAGAGSDDGPYAVLSTGYAHLYGFFEWKSISTAADGDIAVLYADDGSSILMIIRRNGGYLNITDAVAYQNGASFSLATSTKYYIWWEYHKGTGSNQVGKLFISTSTTKPGSPDGSFTNGARTLSAKYPAFGSCSSIEVLYDHIRIATSDITGYP
jgi:hypothetical protein